MTATTARTGVRTGCPRARDGRHHLVFGYDEDEGVAGRGCAHCQWVEHGWKVPEGDEERSRDNAETSQETHERYCDH